MVCYEEFDPICSICLSPSYNLICSDCANPEKRIIRSGDVVDSFDRFNRDLLTSLETD